MTDNVTQYIVAPRPTGSVLSAIDSYGDELIKTCDTGTALLSCPYPDQKKWCGLSTAAPAAYSSYGSMAASWWSAHSSAAVSAAGYCPNNWYRVMWETPGAATWLNLTMMFAECYGPGQISKGAGPLTTGPSAVSATRSTSRSSSGGSQGVAVAPVAAKTNLANRVIVRTEIVEKWMVAGSGLAAAAAAANRVW